MPITPAPSPPLVLETFSAEEDDEPFEEVQVEGVQVPDGDTLAERAIKSMAEPAAACARLEEDVDGESTVQTPPEPTVQAATFQSEHACKLQPNKCGEAGCCIHGEVWSRTALAQGKD